MHSIKDQRNQINPVVHKFTTTYIHMHAALQLFHVYSLFGKLKFGKLVNLLQSVFCAQRL